MLRHHDKLIVMNSDGFTIPLLHILPDEQNGMSQFRQPHMRAEKRRRIPVFFFDGGEENWGYLTRSFVVPKR